MVGNAGSSLAAQRDLLPNQLYSSRSHYSKLQFRRMYRYGLALLLVGALCNWIGFAQHYFAPVRYLGVGCVLAGAVCICIALCRWLTVRNAESTQEMVCSTSPSIHVITVPVQNPDQSNPMSKPPDYETVIGSSPPSYEEAIRATPAAFLHHSSQETPTPSTQTSQCSLDVEQSTSNDQPNQTTYIDRINSLWRHISRRNP